MLYMCTCICYGFVVDSILYSFFSLSVEIKIIFFCFIWTSFQSNKEQKSWGKTSANVRKIWSRSRFCVHFSLSVPLHTILLRQKNGKKHIWIAISNISHLCDHTFFHFLSSLWHRAIVIFVGLSYFLYKLFICVFLSVVNTNE